ncbi:MAG: 1,6-anhydro-N-acetylmuramyl-L-alanine amidase AmpD [Cellvibrionaceae bacterium]
MLASSVNNSSEIKNGWLTQAWRVLSPNFDERPACCDIDLLVIHNISLPPEQYGGGHVQQLFCNILDCNAHPYFDQLRDLKVSSHVFIDREGKVTQFVPFQKRAWHAGVSNYQGRAACNDFAIGIELEGVDDQPYTDAQYEELIKVTLVLCKNYPSLMKKNSDDHNSDHNIVGHNDIAPGRKTDPGQAFDWDRYRLALKGSQKLT